MKRQKSQHSTIGIIGKAVVTVTLFGCTAIPYCAHAAQGQGGSESDIYVAILSPSTDASDPNKQIEISAFYQAAPVTGGVTTLELYVDGQQEAIKKLDNPEDRGVVSFIISPGTLSAGSHEVVVRVSASDAEIASAKTGLNISQPVEADSGPDVSSAIGGTSDDGAPPAVAIMAPLSNASVSGTVDIKVDAHDDSGKPPYVSLFIDHNFKTLRNFPPFDFAWDTTRVANGPHTIEVWGYNEEEAVGHAQPLTVLVNNPGGRTLVRHDLLDTVPGSILTDDTERAKASTPIHSATAKNPAALAKGPSISVHLQKLASADFIDDSSSVSEETQLMAPFLPAQLPQHVQAVITATPPVAPSHPALASILPAPAGVAQLSQYATDDSMPEEATQLVTPDIAMPTQPVYQHMPAAAAEPATHETKLTIERETPVASSPVRNDFSEGAAATKKASVQSASALISSVDLSPNLAPSALALPDTLHLDSSSAPAITDAQPEAGLESPSTEILPMHVRRAAVPVRVRELMARARWHGSVAEERSVGLITLDSTMVASASISTTSLFSAESMLQAPEVPTHRMLQAITTHRVQTQLEPLGSSVYGFNPASIVKSELVMNDRLLSLNEPLQDRDKFLFAPFRQIFESEGGIMAWNPEMRQVHALNGSRDVEITIGSRTALVNQEIVTLNACPYLTAGHTMIPLAFVPIALDATVSYDPASGHIVINSNN